MDVLRFLIASSGARRWCPAFGQPGWWSITAFMMLTGCAQAGCMQSKELGSPDSLYCGKSSCQAPLPSLWWRHWVCYSHSLQRKERRTGCRMRRQFGSSHRPDDDSRLRPISRLLACFLCPWPRRLPRPVHPSRWLPNDAPTAVLVAAKPVDLHSLEWDCSHLPRPCCWGCSGTCLEDNSLQPMQLLFQKSRSQR